MSRKYNGLAGWCIVSLLSIASFAANNQDLRLAEAGEKGDMQTMRSLLKQHAVVNSSQADGTTALAWAVYWDDLDMAGHLVAAGADVNASNDYGVTPLSLACTNRNAAMVERLLKAGAIANSAQTTGVTALMTCARTGNVDAVKSLLAREARVNASETQLGQTALMWAIAEKHPEAARALIERGADVRARSKNGFTPLMFAAQQGDTDSVRTLLAAGADVNDTTPNGMTALLVASASGHEAVAVYLLDHGADSNATDADGMTPLHYSVLKGIALLADLKFNPVLAHLFRPNMPELAKALLAHGANPNPRVTKNPAGATPFLLAAATSDVSIMRILAAGGASPLAATKTNITALMAAAGMGRREDRTEEEERSSLEAVKVVVELGGDVNATNQFGQTALHAAAYMGADDIIQFLASKGAKVDAKDKYGQTPLSIAENVITPELVNFDFRPFVIHQSTADLLLKLGATPVSASSAKSSGSPSVTPAQ